MKKIVKTRNKNIYIKQLRHKMSKKKKKIPLNYITTYITINNPRLDNIIYYLNNIFSKEFDYNLIFHSFWD